MKFVTIFLLFGVLHSASFGKPQGGEVVLGEVTFQKSGSNLTIQASNQSVINWQNFSIAGGETVHFIQPSSYSRVLNRIASNASPSQILGSLRANDTIYLVNPAGIVFGESGQIPTGGFLATSGQAPQSFLENEELKLPVDSKATNLTSLEIISPEDSFANEATTLSNALSFTDSPLVSENIQLVTSIPESSTQAWCYACLGFLITLLGYRKRHAPVNSPRRG